ncbi:MAG TPA: hypothetical protein DGB85_10895 [Deltaproteobacteria bacterium]|nr:hypothetical protein [Deltaproteobacteria bacterium]
MICCFAFFINNIFSFRKKLAQRPDEVFLNHYNQCIIPLASSSHLVSNSRHHHWIVDRSLRFAFS